VAGPLGQMLRCRVTAGEGTDMPERSAARGGVDIDLLHGGDRKFESLLLQRRVRLSPGAAFEGREPRLGGPGCVFVRT
jgi:hypothetical protein